MEDNIDEHEFKLDKFLLKNNYLFASLGIFGAMSIYLINIEAKSINVNTNILQFGIFSSLLLFVFISLLVLYKTFESDTNASIPLSFLTLKKENLERLFFIVPFSTLLMTVLVFMITNFLGALVFIASMITYVVGMMLFFGILSFACGRIKIVSRTIVVWLTSVAILIAVMSIIVFSGFYYVMNEYKVAPIMLFFSSLVTGAIIAFAVSSITLIIVPLNQFYEKVFKE